MHQLSFRSLLHYDRGGTGIRVPVVLSVGDRRVKLIASLDTGASFCILQRDHGVALGLDIESGLKQKVAAVTGSFDVYGHTLEMQFLGIQMETMIYFFAEASYQRNVLGRRGCIDRLRLGIVDYDARLYASPHDES